MANAGNYEITIDVKNSYGRDKKKVFLKIGDQIVLAPPLGWNSWNSFACDVTDDNIRNAAEQLVNLLANPEVIRINQDTFG